MRFNLLVLSALMLSGAASADQKGPNLERHVQPGPNGNLTQSGNLDGSATFDRQFLVTYDGSCAAASSDSSNDGVSYDTYSVYSPSGQNMQAEVVLNSLTDSVLFVYCTPFDALNPTTNMRAWDDDGGVGLGSAIVAADGVAMVPNEVYTLVVSGFGNTDLGTYDLVLGGDLEFGTPGTPLGPTRELPTLSWQATLLLLLGIGVAGTFILRRRRHNV
jgi:hypothetical protein